MTISRISSRVVWKNTLQANKKSEESLVKHQRQMVGTKIGCFYENPLVTSEVLQKQDSMQIINQELNNFTHIGQKIDSTLVAMDNINQTLDRFMQDFIYAKNNNSYQRVDFNNTATKALNSIVSALNTKVQDQYIFSGSALDKPSINSDLFAVPPNPGDALDLSFYGGDGANLEFKDNTGQTFIYNQNALVYQDVIKSLLLCKSTQLDFPLNPLSEQKLEAAFTMLKNSLPPIRNSAATLGLVNNNMQHQKNLFNEFSVQYAKNIDAHIESCPIEESFNIQKANLSFNLSMNLIKDMIEVQRSLLN